MKVFIKSCHGSLEYDHARMFVDMGYEVGGDWDLGGTQRPKIIGVTDRNFDINNFDVVVLHQVSDFGNVMDCLLQSGKKVVSVAFGQGSMEQHNHVSALCRNYPNAYVAAYSRKDFRIYQECQCPPQKLELIRFGKYLEDYGNWVGKWPVCYISCNSIHKREVSCGWHILETTC